MMPARSAPRLLVLTAGYGEGHNAAARNLAAAFDREAGPGTARTVDVFALASPRLNAFTRKAYLVAINRTPRVWSRLFAWLDRHPPFPRHLGWLRRERAELERLLKDVSPTAVCSTYPVYAFLLEDLRHSGVLRCPHYNVVTDSISIHSLWCLPRCDGWFVPNAATAQVMAGFGLNPRQIHPLGFPVDELFSQPGSLAPPDLARGQAPRVLYLVHSGNQHAESTARRLLAETDWEITCAVGRDTGLRHRLQSLARNRSRPATILGWTNDIPRLLLTHHAVVSKAGGATTQEAIAARCPMIVNQIVPGQEEGNYALLQRHGIGAYAPHPDAVIAALRSAFASNARVWGEWRRALAALTRPHAARDIARHVLQATAEFTGTAPANAVSLIPTAPDTAPPSHG